MRWCVGADHDFLMKMAEVLEFAIRGQPVCAESDQRFGRALSPNTLCQQTFRIFRRAGIAGASSHSLRRSFINSLAIRGIGIRVLASLAGHQSIFVTRC
jgi:site-specific recombinase XerD